MANYGANNVSVFGLPVAVERELTLGFPSENRPDGLSATSKAVQVETFFGVTFSTWIPASDVLSS
jgi:hypothetical protein